MANNEIMMETSQWENADRREGPRFRLQLSLAVVYPQRAGSPARPMYQGKTQDIGMSGLSMVVDYNVSQEGEIALVLALPPEYEGAPQKVVTCTAEITYAIHSSKLDAYKIGFAFREFRGNGKALLEAALQRELKKNDGDSGTQGAGRGSNTILPVDSQPLGRW